METTIKKSVNEETLPNGDVRLSYDGVLAGSDGLIVILLFGFGALCLLSGLALLSDKSVDFTSRVIIFIMAFLCFKFGRSLTRGCKNKTLTITPNVGVTFESDKQSAKFDDITNIGYKSSANFSMLVIHVGGQEVSISGLTYNAVAMELGRLVEQYSGRSWN